MSVWKRRSLFGARITLFMILGACSALLGPDLKPGQELSKAGKHGAALKYYQEIIEADGANAKVYRFAYESAFKTGKRLTAANYYESALQKGYNRDSLRSLAANLWYVRAQMLMGQDEWESAQKAADQLSQFAPGSNLEKYCSNILAGKKKYDRGSHKGLWDAVNDYSKASNYDMTSGLPYFLMGQARYKNDRNDYDAALEDYYQSLKIEPDGYFSSQARADIKKIEAIKKKMQAFWGK